MDFKEEYDILKDKVEQALDGFFKKEIKAAANNESIVNIRNACLNKGKRIRPISLIAGYDAIKGDRGEGVVDAACSLEILHAYFLIHDDIMDQDRIRRNKDTLHIVYQKKLGDSGLPTAQAIRGGENLAILDGDICCALAKKPILNSNFSPERKCAALEELIDIELKTGFGQRLDEMSKHGPVQNPVEYVQQIHKYKIAWYTHAGPLRIGAKLAGATNSQIAALTDYGLAVGLAFQIKDDMMGVLSPDSLKKAKNDITEGKLTMPVAMLLTCGNEEQIDAVKGYMGKPLTAEDTQKVIAILTDSGALANCQEMAESYVTKAQRVLQTNTNLLNREFLSSLADYVINRTR